MSDSKVQAESIVWKQFKKRKMGVASLVIILTLFAVAIYAPLLANNNPIALKTTYGVLYEYYWAGWQAIHKTTYGALTNRDALIKTEKDALAGYDAKRDELRKITTAYNDIGNRYDAARDEVNRLQDQIDILTDQIGAAREAGAPIAELEAQLAPLSAQRAEAAEVRKQVGGEKARIKREIDGARSEQSAFNDQILKARFRLDFEHKRKAILLNIAQMQHFVDAETQARLSQFSERYDALYATIETSSKDTAPILTALKEIEAEAKGAVGPQVSKAHLEYRWTFPVFAQMDWVDRAFALAYPIFILLILLGSSIRPTVATRLGAAVVAGLILSLITGLASWDLPNRNYQDLMIDTIAEGYTDTVAIMPPVPYGMAENRFEEPYHRPSFVADEDGFRSRHLLGTDDSGRDVSARMIWGARVSLSVGFVAVGLYLLIGIVVGALAGFFGGRVDLFLSRVIEIVICFPSLFLILTVIAFIGPSIYNVMIVIGLTGWTGIARLTRAEFLRLRSQDFVVAAEATGNSRASIMFRHVLPNAMTPVLVSAAFGFAGSILLESGLSFLGFGVQEPFPSWGQMLADGKANPLLYWWLFIVPGIALFMTVTVYNLAGNAFRDASDPRLRK